MGMLDENTNRDPNRYPWVDPMKKAMWHGFWTVEKFPFDSDLRDFHITMRPEQKQLVVRALACVAQIEVKVKTYWAMLGLHVKDPIIVGGGIVMAGVEEIHNDAYEQLLKKLNMLDTLREVLEVPAINARVGYLTKHTLPIYGKDPKKQFAYSLGLFTMFVEYVSLFNAFYAILYLNREHNILKDTSQQVKYTRNEETIHAQFGMNIIAELRREYPEIFDAELEGRFYEEARVAVACEDRLIDWMLEGFDEPACNPALLKSYTRVRMNEALEGLGYKAVFEVPDTDIDATNWMKVGVLAPAKVDFFHGESTAYVQGDRPDDDDDF